MRKRLFAVYLLIALAPPILLVWIGARMIRDGETAAATQREAVLLGRLDSLAEEITRLLEAKRRILHDAARREAAKERLDDVRWDVPESARLAVISLKGEVLYPPSIRDHAMLAFCEFAQALAREGIAPEEGDAQAAGNTVSQSDFSRSRPSGDEGIPSADKSRSVVRAIRDDGWRARFWGQGLGLIYWLREPDGRYWVADYPRARLLADIIGILPDGAVPGGGGMALHDADGETLYRWGEALPAEGVAHRPGTRAARGLEPPLAAWRLEYGLPRAGAGASQGMLYGLLAAVGVAFSGLALYFYREATRELREAGARVSFVNQVSHELRTPLTNIRLHAELLDEDMPDGNARAKLGIILNETKRLGRLIANVLAFARSRRGTLRLHPVTGVPDEVIGRALQHFAPALERNGMPWTFDAGAGRSCRLDADVLEQILNNLLSNAVKYAPGAALAVKSELDGGTLRVRVRDGGPGIPARKREAVFLPFVRLDDRLTEGVSGTGIGLSVSRELSRLHGGGVTIEPSPGGACFLVELAVTPEGGDA